MSRITLAFNKLFEFERLGEEDLKVYAEASLLGVKDYPLFYTNKLNRLPVMAGIILPGFRFLDLVALQVEYFNSPYVNSIQNRAQNHGVGGAQLQYNTPWFPGASPAYSKKTYNDVTKDDNISWSLLIKKEIVPGLTLSSQFGKDHLRLVSSSVFWGQTTDNQELTSRLSDWYWLIQLSLGI